MCGRRARLAVACQCPLYAMRHGTLDGCITTGLSLIRRLTRATETGTTHPNRSLCAAGYQVPGSPDRMKPWRCPTVARTSAVMPWCVRSFRAVRIGTAHVSGSPPATQELKRRRGDKPREAMCADERSTCKQGHQQRSV